MVKELRARSAVPLLLMTYYNPVFKYGEEGFLGDAVHAGIDGVIIPDLPPDEAGGLLGLSRRAGFATIFLLAPTSTGDRIRKVGKASTGFIYYVSMTGITGSRLSLDGSFSESVQHIRRTTGKPVAVGFGVSTPEEAKVVAEISDGVIVGSAIVRRLHDSPDSLESFILDLRRAI
jgi:tryptophan synthase alpha chain